MVSVNSSTGSTALKLIIDDGQYNLISGAGSEVLAGGYTVNMVDEVKIRIDLDADNFSLELNDSTVASGKPFLDSTFTDLRTLKFEYPPAILEAFPAVHVADKIKMCALGSESGRRGTVYERLTDDTIGNTIASARLRFLPEMRTTVQLRDSLL
jgi:hypothetical protein